jgi:hypothetical protein
MRRRTPRECVDYRRVYSELERQLGEVPKLPEVVGVPTATVIAQKTKGKCFNRKGGFPKRDWR